MRRSVKGLLLGVMVGLAGAILAITPLGQDFEKHVGLDWLFFVRGPVIPPPNVAVVAINSRDVAGLGLPSLPRDWNRAIHGQLVRRLDKLGAAAIVFDMDFQRPKKAEDDAAFAHAVAESGRVVLFERLDGKRQPLFDSSGNQIGTVWMEQLVPPIPMLAEAARALAPFPVPKVQVNVYQYWAFKPSTGYVATMPAAALQLYALPVQQIWMELLSGSGAQGIEDLPRTSDEVGRADSVRQLMFGLRESFSRDSSLSARVRKNLAEVASSQSEHTVRLLNALVGLYEGDDQRYLNFYGPAGTIPNIPFNSVFQNDPAKLPDVSGKVVFVGLSDLFDPGQPDRFYTVYTNDHGVDLSGVEIAATAFANLLTDSALIEIGPLTTACILLVFGILFGCGIYLLNASRAVPIALLLGVVFVLAVQYLFNTYALWLPLAIPLLLQLPVALVAGLLGHYLSEASARRRLKAVFGQYVPSEIVEEMSRDSEKNFSVDGESRELTVLFCDVRGFTAISESLAADELKQFLNYFFTPMTRIVFEQRGTIDKYVGDMLMAFWGAPLRDPGHAQHAVEAALLMLEQIADMQSELAARNWPAIKVGIGINSGIMNVGDMGSEYRRAYTVIGDAVNLGARLEGLTKYYEVPLVISEHTVEHLKGMLLRKLDRVKVRGKQKPVTIYEAVSLDAAATATLSEEVAASNHALEHYFRGEWSEARHVFRVLHNAVPQNGFYNLMLRRIDAMEARGIGEDWDGVFEHTTK